jgi:hypothetical protein
MDDTQSVLFEQQFWLPILRDHCQFILDALSIKEKQEIQWAERLYNAFDQLIRREDFLNLEMSLHFTKELRKLKLHLLVRLLTDQIAFNLPPTLINHMLNELDEYVEVLKCLLQQKRVPHCHPLHYHLLWLSDAAVHADVIVRDLDTVEKNFIAKGSEFKRQFEDYYYKAIELSGYIRTNLPTFPALNRFNSEVELEITLFQKFLAEMKEMSLDRTVLGTLRPLFPDHMYREERYYLTKLAQVACPIGSQGQKRE